MIAHFVFGPPKLIDSGDGSEQWELLVKCQGEGGVSDKYFLFDSKESATKFTQEVNSNMEGLTLEEG